MKTMMTRIFIVLCSLVLVGSVSAGKALTPSVYLLSMKALKTAEKGGDELYLHVTVYPSKGKNRHYVIPRHPMHWKSNHVNQIHKLKVWKDALPEGESVTLILSLVERDLPPWNTDDLIGTVRVRLHNAKGRLESNWTMPNRIDSPVTTTTKYGPAEKFELLNESASYLMYFMLNQKG